MLVFSTQLCDLYSPLLLIRGYVFHFKGDLALILIIGYFIDKKAPRYDGF